MTPDQVAELVRNVRFGSSPFRGGYDMGEVDAFLDEVEEAARRGGDIGALVRNKRFRLVKWRQAYVTEDVDQFLTRLSTLHVEPAADTGGGPAPGGAAGAPASGPASQGDAWAIRSMVERARFTPVRLREGYDMGEVDQLLDEVVAAAERGEPVGPVIDRARFTPVRLREGYDMGEVDALLRRLKGEAPRPADVTDPGVIQEQRGLLDRLFRRS